MSYPVPNNEQQRLAALSQYEILDTEPESAFDDLTRLAAYICGVPIAAVSFVDETRQWFKSIVGLDATETPRDVAFCAHTIAERGIFVVQDATKDIRFSSNPLVLQDPEIRFYAGAPLETPDGFALGSLCVIDTVPRNLTADQLEALRSLAREVSTHLDLKKQIIERNAAYEAVEISEKRLKVAQKIGRIGSWEFDILTGKITWSAEIYNILDFDPQYGEPDYEQLLTRYHPDDIPAHNEVVRKAFTDGTPYQIDLRIIHRDGSVRWGHASGTADLWSDGKVIRLSGTIADVTEQIEARLLIERERERLQAVVAAQSEISSVTSSTAVMDVGTRHAMAITNADGVAIQMRCNDHMVSRVSHGILAAYPNLKIPLDGTLVGECVRTGESQYSAHAERDARVFQPPRNMIGYQSLLTVPLNQEATTLGAIFVVSKSPDAFSAADTDGLLLIAGMIAAGISRELAAESKAQVLSERTKALVDLQESQALYLASLDAMQDGYIVQDKQGNVLTCNASLERMLEIEPESLVGTNINNFEWEYYGEEGSQYQVDDNPSSSALRSCQTQTAIAHLQSTSGSAKWLALVVSPLFRVGALDPYATVASVRDVTQQREVDEALKVSMTRLTEAQRVARIGSWEFDLQSESYWFSAEMYKLFGLDPNRPLPSKDLFRSKYHPDDLAIRDAAIAKALDDGSPYEFDCRISTGHEPAWIWCHARGEVRRDTLGKPTMMAGTLMDITARKAMEEQLRDYSVALAFQKQELEASNDAIEMANKQLKILASHDGLTGLKNHRTIHEKLNEELARARRYGMPLALMMLDVDHFKAYNDTFGHPEGDTVLRQVSDIVRSCIRECDTAGRYGGEEFMVILPQTDTDGALAIAERVRTAACDYAWQKRIITVSIGLCLLTTDIIDVGTFVANVDDALYQAKRNGRNRVMVHNGAALDQAE
ncbi:MAG TPA: diguanylate cyclase [Capsulimonadaceae bacterium]|jgi:diguanylate cyclase (GGDEF)-like protein/PAS domain S-box-containing protein